MYWWILEYYKVMSNELIYLKWFFLFLIIFYLNLVIIIILWMYEYGVLLYIRIVDSIEGIFWLGI